MDLTHKIESVELRYKETLEEFFNSVYDDKFLASHGLDHHRRVWIYSKQLLALMADHMNTSDLLLPSKLIISSYLHDIGMSVDTGRQHGKHSRDICTQFLNSNNLPLNVYRDVLEAIENHDSKDYQSYTDGSTGNLLRILSIADDLDAFGFIGIYRYTEIYLARGIRYDELGSMIIENASKRFENLVNIMGFDQSFIQKHKTRYQMLQNFFGNYNDQIPSYRFGMMVPSGYCGVVELISHIIEGEISLQDLLVDNLYKSSDPVIDWYLGRLSSELS